MFEFALKLHDELILKLADIDENYEPAMLAPDPRAGVIGEALERMKEKLRSYQFINPEEEVAFFKTVLPNLLSLAIYYKERFELESVRFLALPKFQRKYVDRLFCRMENFYQEQVTFLKYCRSGRTDQDPYFFLREAAVRQGYADFLEVVIDSSFCTVHSVILARLLAYSRLLNDIRFIMTGDRAALQDPENNQTVMKWTDPKTGIVELIYSLTGKGAFNHGKADLKSVTRYFEKVFCIKLENISRSFQEILSRKKEETSYIGKLKAVIDNRK